MCKSDLKKKMIKIALIRGLANAGKNVGKGAAGASSAALKAGLLAAKGVGKGVGLGAKGVKSGVKAMANLKNKDIEHIIYAGLAGGAASKLHKSYKNPDGTLNKAHMAYLKSRYLPGGYLNSISKGVNSIRKSMYKLVGPPRLSDHY